MWGGTPARRISPSRQDKLFGLSQPPQPSEKPKLRPFRPTINFNHVEPFTKNLIRTIGWGLAGRPLRPSLRRWSGPQRIIEQVASKHKVTLAEMKGQGRNQRYVKARQEAFYRIRKECGYSLPEIGQLFGGRDHTTILHGIRRHEAMLASATL